MELTAGKVAVVTGAASGIGLALAERFARAGLDVVLADIEPAALEAAEQKIAALGVRTLAVPTDVSDEAAVQALAAASVDRFGAVHVVCNNAGVVSTADPWFGPARHGGGSSASTCGESSTGSAPSCRCWPARARATS